MLQQGSNQIQADYAVVNADYAYAQLYLLKRRIPRFKYSCSTYLIYLGLNKKLGNLVHHNLFFARDLKNNLNEIFIYPGYDFKVIDGLLTNYHAPGSTVLMLTAAFAGWDKLLPAYNHAIAEKYHFFSYGDSMLIL